MANFITRELDLVLADGWVELGDHTRQDTLIDLFNESTDVLRIYMGDAIASGDTVPSVPIPADSNYYIDCVGNTSRVYVKTAGTAKVSFVEG